MGGLQRIYKQLHRFDDDARESSAPWRLIVHLPHWRGEGALPPAGPYEKYGPGGRGGCGSLRASTTDLERGTPACYGWRRIVAWPGPFGDAILRESGFLRADG